ncbi:hypothetical protein [Micromonospora sp. NPDC092111]|uniref:hypothetical protein n=1 Tax=Micromonospora sp. NPDC092111 TaxID=3364289 RepID=UPI00381838F2
MDAHGLDRETVERLLSGPVVDPPDGPGPLVALLTAVRTAPHPGELPGERAAVQAFHAVRAGPPGPAATNPPGPAVPHPPGAQPPSPSDGPG